MIRPGVTASLCALFFAAAFAQTAGAQSPLASETPYSGGPLPGVGMCNDTALSPQRPLAFPADDAPHRGDRNIWEWWWWTGHVVATPVDASGRRIGAPKRYSVTLVHEWKPLLRLQQTSYFIGDVAAGKTHYGRQGDVIGDPDTTRKGFALRGPHSWARGGDGRDRLHIDVNRHVLDATWRAKKPPLLHFGSGHTSLYCQTVAYYQRQRMAIKGTLVARGVRMRVRGVGTFDHQWGFVPAYQIAQSRYLALTLDDGTDVYLGEVRFPPVLHSLGIQAPESLSAYVRFGSISDPDGRVTILDKDDFTVTPTAHWRPSSTCAYPVAYDISVKGRSYKVKPTILEGESRSEGSPLSRVLWAEDATFWDGETSVSGDGTGHGWLDLVRACPER